MKDCFVISELLNKKGVSEIIKVVDFNESQELNQLCDARSAAFLAMGVAIRTQGTCALIVPGKYITNILTAVTEAWFQKCNLLIVGIFENITDFHTSWMDRYLVGRLDLRLEELEKESESVGKLLSTQGPKLLSVLCPPEHNEKHDYGELLDILLSSNLTGVTITCYNALLKTDQENNESIKNIGDRFKYGMISKYIGSSLSKSAGILLCTSECLLVDINVFRTKYKSEWMKVIIHDCYGIVKEKKIDEWIQSNGWFYMETGSISSSIIEEFALNKKASVLVVR